MFIENSAAMDEGTINFLFFFIGKVSDSVLLVFGRDLGTGVEISVLPCLLHVKNQAFLAHWENERQRVDCKSKGVCYSSDSKGHCRAAFTSRLVTIT